MDSSLFKGIILGVSIKENPFATRILKGIRHGLEECTLLQAFERCGGTLVDFDCGSEGMEVTHVVARHAQQLSYTWGKSQGKTLVNCLWIWDCLRLQNIFPTRDQIYQPFPGEAIIGAEGCYVTITGYISHQRHVVQHTIESLGMGLMLEMKPGRCTHVIAADVLDKTSRKVMAAQGEEFKHRIKVVNTAWLYDCARNWDILPADAYLDNAPLDQDPVQGAPLMSFSEANIVANTPEKSSGMSQGTSLGDRQVLLQSDAAETHHAPCRQESTELFQDEQSLGTVMYRAELSRGETAHGEVALTGERLPSGTRKANTRGGLSVGRPPRTSTTPLAQELLPEPASASRRLASHTPGTAVQSRHSSPPVPLEDRLPALSSRRLTGRTPAGARPSPAGTSGADGPSAPRINNGKGLEVAKSSHRLAMETPAAQPASQHPPSRLSHPSRPQLASSLWRRAPSGVSPSPGGVPHMAVAGEAAGPFAPIAAADLYGSEVAFGCDDLGAAEAIAGQLAYQLGPSLDFGPGAPGGSPASSASVSPHPASGPPPAGTKTRVPLSELAPGTVRGALQSRNPPQSEGVRAIRNGTPQLLEPDTCHPKTATKGKLGGRKGLSSMLKGRLTSGSKSKRQGKQASALQYGGEEEGQQSGTINDKTALEPSSIPVPSTSGQKRKQENSPSALGGRARRKLGPPNSLLTDLDPPDLEQPSPAQPYATRTTRGGKAARPGAAKLAKEVRAAVGKVPAKRGRKRAQETVDDDPQSSLPAAAAAPGGAKGKRKKPRKQPQTPDTSQEEPVAAKEGGLAQDCSPQALLPGRANGSLQKGSLEAESAIPAAGHTAHREVVEKQGPVSTSGPKSRSVAPERHRPHRAVVLLSGMHTEEQRQNLRALSGQGITCISGKCERWPIGVTHIVEPQLSRSMKTLAGLACGAWVVSTAFVAACQASCGLVEADNYELQTGKPGIIEGRAPKHWRLRCGLLGSGAFHGLQVTMFGKIGSSGGPSRTALATIIKAGGGEIYSIQHALRHGTDLAVMEADTVATDANVKRLLALQVTCVTPLYIIEWLARPWTDLRSHVLFGSKPDGTLALAESQRGLTADAALLQNPASPSL